jgi:hypothetical protein
MVSHVHHTDGAEELADGLDIQEYLLLKGVEAVAIHGSKSKRDPSILRRES